MDAHQHHLRGTDHPPMDPPTYRTASPSRACAELVVCCTTQNFEPSAFIAHTSASQPPSRQDSQAIRDPSGDHLGWVSCGPSHVSASVSVRLPDRTRPGSS